MNTLLYTKFSFISSSLSYWTVPASQGLTGGVLWTYPHQTGDSDKVLLALLFKLILFVFQNVLSLVDSKVQLFLHSLNNSSHQCWNGLSTIVVLCTQIGQNSIHFVLSCCHYVCVHSVLCTVTSHALYDNFILAACLTTVSLESSRRGATYCLHLTVVHSSSTSRCRVFFFSFLVRVWPSSNFSRGFSMEALSCIQAKIPQIYKTDFTSLSRYSRHSWCCTYCPLLKWKAMQTNT